jgi:hypothetical protein
VPHSDEPSPEKVDPRGPVRKTSQALAARNFSGIEESQEAARQWAQKFLFYLIAGCLIFLALFDAALLLPSVHVETKVIITVNSAFAGGSGLLGVCASYILAPYKAPRRRRNSRTTEQ